MTRVLWRWLVLAPVMLATWAALLFVVFDRIDLRFESFAALVVVPLAQAAVMTWVATPPRGRFAATWTVLAAVPLARPVLLADVVLFAVGWILWTYPVVGFAGDGPVQSTWAGTKAVVAGAWLISAPRNGGRLALGAMALALGAAAWIPWLSNVADVVGSMVPGMPLVNRWLVGYGLVWATTCALLVRASRAPDLPTSASHLLEAAVAALVLVAAVLLLNGFNYRDVREPFGSIALNAASLSATLILLAALIPSTGARA